MVEKGYIDREVAFDMITDLAGMATTKAAYAAIWKSAKELNKIPAADVEPVRHGHWILLRESEITGFNPEFAGRDPIGGYQCSNCKEEAIFDCNDEFVLSSYCPNCGAKMDGERKEHLWNYQN